MSRRPLLNLISLALALFLASSTAALARTVRFSVHDLEKPSRVARKVEQLAPGDLVQVTDAGGKVTNEFRLGEFVGQGFRGRVFRIDGSSKVVKFQGGEDEFRSFMRNEIRSLEDLHKMGVPVVGTHESNPKLFVVKDLVAGETLDDLDARWLSVSPAEMRLRLESLRELLGILGRQDRHIQDLHAGNLIFDRAEGRWLVLDPGQVVDGPGSRTLEYFWEHLPERVSSSLKVLQESPEAFDAYHALQSASDRLMRARAPDPDAVRTLLQFKPEGARGELIAAWTYGVQWLLKNGAGNLTPEEVGTFRAALELALPAIQDPYARFRASEALLLARQKPRARCLAAALADAADDLPF